jgi:hypothetical protein
MIESPCVTLAAGRPVSGLGPTIARTTALALVLWYAGRDLMPRSTDFLCYWSAGKLLAEGQSPYDPVAQARIQHDLGWDKVSRGGGRYDFLPYYCPPWFAIFCMPFGVFGYPGAERAWFLVNITCLLLSAVLLKRALPSLPFLVPSLGLFGFYPTLLALFAGQTTPLILLLLTAAWCLLEARRDGIAGALLAGTTIKPQLALVLVAGILLWALRRRRLRVLLGFAMALGLFCLASTALVPSWPLQMLRATRVTPLPTDLWPWVGVTWTLALRTLGLQGWALGALYAAAAIPMTAQVLAAAWNPARPLGDVLALGAVAAFFVSPYAQLYDFPILVIPLLVLVADRLATRGGGILLAAALVAGWLHVYLLLRMNEIGNRYHYFDKYLFMWIPLLLAVVWFASERTGKLGSKAESLP